MSLTEKTRMWSQHRCQWPLDQNFGNICGVTANFKDYDDYWYCAEHYDLLLLNVQRLCVRRFLSFWEAVYYNLPLLTLEEFTRLDDEYTEVTTAL